MTILDKIGGAAVLHKVVDKFYELVLADPKLAPHFKGFDIPKVKAGQEAFLTMVKYKIDLGFRWTQQLPWKGHEDCPC